MSIKLLWGLLTIMSWAARYNIWRLIKLTLKSVVFCFHFFSHHHVLNIWEEATSVFGIV